MTDTPTPYATYIISAGRAGNVPDMTAHARAMRPTWVVPQRDAPAYRAAGAARILTPLGGLSAARNAALRHAFGQRKWCVQLDDDLRHVKRCTDQKTTAPLRLPDAVTLIIDAMHDTGARLGGVAPTANPYFSRRTITTRGFMLGSFIVAAPNPLRFDTALPLKEDWDYTCAHLDEYGCVARCDDILAEFRHYTNPGGVQTYRTDALETEITRRLLERWPGYLRPHPRRPHELALRRATSGDQPPTNRRTASRTAAGRVMP